MRKNSEFDCEICIVGAGIAGTILAANLAKLNYRIIVLEKSLKEQEKISGELLQPGGVNILKEMKLDFLLKEIDAQKVEGYTLFLKDEHYSIPYQHITPKKNISGFSFKNSRFVNSARNFIKNLDQVTLIEGNVNKLIEKEGVVEGISYFSQKDKKNHTLKTKLTFVCEGASSKLAKHTTQSTKKISSFFVGLVLKNCSLPIPNQGHVILTGESPILIYPISDKETRILIDFPGKYSPKINDEFKNYLKEKILPHLPLQIQSSFKESIEESKIKCMPNQNFKAQPLKDKKRIIMLGDSFNMRHPLTGGGMSAVFNDIKNIIKLIKNKTGKKDLDHLKNINHLMNQYYKKRTKDVANINILADSLYHATSDPYLKTASFDYLKKESNQKDTIRIIAGIDKKKYNLIQHFFLVVLNGIGNLDISYKKKIDLLSKSIKIIFPLFIQEADNKVYRWINQLFYRFLKIKPTKTTTTNIKKSDSTKIKKSDSTKNV